MLRSLTTAILLVSAAACRGGPSTVSSETPDQVLARLNSGGHAVDAHLGGSKVRYLGFEVLPATALPGDTVTLVHYWVATEPVDAAYQVFVHFLVQGARGWIPHADHVPVPATNRWPAGRVIRDEHQLRLPQHIPGDSVEVRLGLYAGPRRMPVDEPRLHDGDHRLLAGRFPVGGNAVARPQYDAPRLAQPPKLDGTIEEAEWGGAPWIEAFVPAIGRGTARVQTRARLAWDEEHLYLAFWCEDPDIQATLTARDAPVYREEAVEIFIDSGAGRRDYVELQVSPRGTQFDAAFRGGPRRDMQTGWNARYQVAVAVDGSIGQGGDEDKSWSSEWSIEAASLPGVERLQAGKRWRINLFRVAKDRIAGRQVPDESAWSPPLMGDFHNLERFGDLWFKDGSAGVTAKP